MNKTVPSLDQLQSALGVYILHGQTEIVSHIAAQGGLGVQDRLNIYHTAYRLRLLEVLQDHFAKTHAYMGDDFFESEARAYIESHPPAEDNLRYYGQSWPQWLSKRYPQDTDMADLSRLEWALRSAFDAADAPVLAFADVADLTPAEWDQLGFELAPGTDVLTFSHDIIPLWMALSQDTAPAPVSALVHDVMVWRQGWQPHFRSLASEEAHAIRCLLSGQSFSFACAQALAALNEADATAMASKWLQLWMSEQLLAGIISNGILNTDSSPTSTPSFFD